jgi:hypothetical protein
MFRLSGNFREPPCGPPGALPGHVNGLPRGRNPGRARPASLFPAGLESRVSWRAPILFNDLLDGWQVRVPPAADVASVEDPDSLAGQ